MLRLVAHRGEGWAADPLSMAGRGAACRDETGAVGPLNRTCMRCFDWRLIAAGVGRQTCCPGRARDSSLVTRRRQLWVVDSLRMTVRGVLHRGECWAADPLPRTLS